MPYKFPKDPEKPTDLLNRDIYVGDYVAYPALAGRSARMTLGKIVAIRFKKKRAPGDYRSGGENCPRRFAEWYTVQVNRIESTSYYYDQDKQKILTIQKVENLVLVDSDEVEQYLNIKALDADND